MLTPKSIAQAADLLRGASENRQPCHPIRSMIEDGSGIASAYAIQEHNTIHWLKSGRKLSGRKVGLTSKRVQEQLGVPEPDYGMLFEDMRVGDGATVAGGLLLQPK